MVLNWTFESIITIISSIPYFISFYFHFRQYRFHKNKIFLMFFLTWFFYGIYWLINGFSYLFYSDFIFRYDKILLVISSYTVIITYDFINYDRLDAFKLSFLSSINVLLIYSMFLKNSVKPILLDNLDKSFNTENLMRYSINILALFVLIVYTYYTVKIYINTPLKYKKYGLWNLIGIILLGPLTLVSYALQISHFLIGITAIISSLGSTISTIAIVKYPKLIHTLTFRVERLSVIDSQTGSTLYTHYWTENLKFIKDGLFGSVFEGIKLFAEEVLNQGEIQEIVMDKLIIIVKKYSKNNLYFTIMSSKSSKIIRENLEIFIKLFVERFSSKLAAMHGPVLTIQEFNEASDLISKAFPYIPDYTLE